MKIYCIHRNNELDWREDSIDRELMLIDQIVRDLELVTKRENI